MAESSSVNCEEIVSALGGQNTGLGQWIAHCPAHDDKKSSLSITEKDGKVLLHCHAGCSQEAVISALKARGLWRSNVEGKSRIVATYDYVDEQENLLYQVVRFTPKSFKQRRPNGSEGWIWNLQGTRRVLYRLPEVIKAVNAGRPIFIPEGEKDCDRLRNIKLPTTTGCGGAGKWRDEYAETLRGARVVIFPDNDDPGKKYARQIAESLLQVDAKIKIVYLPGLLSKGDISDWLDDGHKREELLQLVKDTHEWKPREGVVESKPTNNKKDFRTRSLIPNLVHHVRKENKVSYLISNDGDLKIFDQFQVDGEMCRPKQDIPFICLKENIIKKKSVKTMELLKCTEEYIRKYVELPNEQLYLVVALYVGHTYFIEPHFNVTPILNVFGVKETGKTRCGEILAAIVYRGERCTSPTEATLFRAAQAFKSTLIIDEIKLWGPDGNRQVADLIKSRYKRGMKVSRINLNKKE